MPDLADTRTSAPHSGHRIMAYCHDSVGVGHLRRTLAVAESVSRASPDVSFLLATGTPFVPLFDPPAAIDYIKLPAICKRSDGSYASKYLDLSTERLIRCREALLLEAAQGFAPDVLLVDKSPLGVCKELLPTLRYMRAQRPDVHLVFGMRDIEDEPEATIEQWTRSGAMTQMGELYDEIWVYGMREVFDVAANYRLPPGTRDKLRYMGYIGRTPCTHALPAPPPQRRVLVTVGGGSDGERLLEAYLAEAAPRAATMGIGSTLVAGPDLPHEARQRLRERAARTRLVEWVEFSGCMSCRIRSADLVVSMGGYNTLCEVAVHRKPVLVLPRWSPRLEQTLRARIWEERSAGITLALQGLDPRQLADRVVDLLIHGPRHTQPQLDLDGLRRVTERLCAIWEGERRHAPAVCL